MIFLLGLLLSILLTLTRIWQLIIIAPILMGFLNESDNARDSVMLGGLMVGFAWFGVIFYYIITQPVLKLFDMVFILIIGTERLGFIAIVLTILIATLIGICGGFTGFALKKLMIKRN
jgi:hypothetical protein